MRVVLIERRAQIGRGMAYSTPHEFHRLNVPASQMGALPRDTGHFVRWASGRGLSVGPGDYAPRGLYGEYLADVLADAERTAAVGVGVERVREEAVRVEAGDRDARVRLGSGRTIEADVVVLALGNLPPADPPGAGDALRETGRYEPDPWDAELYERAAGEHTILLLGTGLTMVDAALALGSAGGPDVIHAVSRKGLLPRVHRDGLPPLGHRIRVRLPAHGLDEVVARVDAEIEATEEGGGDWRQVVDSLRPVTNQVWRRFSDDDRRRFVERLSRRWDVHRHRMAPAVGRMLRRLQVDGRLVIGQAGVGAIEQRGSSLRVHLHGRGGEDTLDVQRVVNCTGPALDLEGARDPLLRAAFADGLIRPGPLHLGLDHDSRGALIGIDGKASRVLYTIGPVRKGRLWETTAIPEIRAQAFELADQITSGLERVSSGVRPEPSGRFRAAPKERV
jgi:uncharacterized NAD(P)/FAD-binding protein YdhS